jgi:hypothetical protein
VANSGGWLLADGHWVALSLWWLLSPGGSFQVPPAWLLPPAWPLPGSAPRWRTLFLVSGVLTVLGRGCSSYGLGPVEKMVYYGTTACY